MFTLDNLFIFSDFDGTITKEDSMDLLIQKCMGVEAKKMVDNSIKQGTLNFRDGIIRQFAGINVSWEEALEILKATTHVDPSFKEFVEYCNSENLPLTVLSCGIGPLIRDFMKSFIGADVASKIQVEANGVNIENNEWKAVFHDDSEFGHDKSLTMRKIKESLGTDAVFVFLGDGLSDISAAREADILFAKKGRDLEEWCIKEKIEHISFENFSEVLQVLKKFVNTREA